jgi:hypothetical protein
MLKRYSTSTLRGTIYDSPALFVLGKCEDLIHDLAICSTNIYLLRTSSIYCSFERFSQRLDGSIQGKLPVLDFLFFHPSFTSCAKVQLQLGKNTQGSSIWQLCTKRLDQSRVPTLQTIMPSCHHTIVYYLHKLLVEGDTRTFFFFLRSPRPREHQPKPRRMQSSPSS